jgi:hypothetical protein
MTVFFSRLYPRSLKKDEKTNKSSVYQSFLADGLVSAGLPGAEPGSAAQGPSGADFPNHSYGNSGGFSPHFL